jgi:hypothetical protein
MQFIISSGSKALSRQIPMPSLEAPLDTKEKDKNNYYFLSGNRICRNYFGFPKTADQRSCDGLLASL